MRFRALARKGKSFASPVLKAVLQVVGPIGAPAAFVEAYYEEKRARGLREDIALAKDEIVALARDAELQADWVLALQERLPEISAKLAELGARVETIEGGLARHEEKLTDLAARVGKVEEKFLETPPITEVAASEQADAPAKTVSRLPLIIGIVGEVGKFIGSHQFDRALDLVAKGVKRAGEGIPDESVREAAIAYLEILAAEALHEKQDYAAEEARYRLAHDHGQRANSRLMQSLASIGLGISLGNRGQLEEAIESFTRATKATPKFSAAWHNRGVALERKGEFDAALECYDVALALRPANPVTLRARGIVLGKMGRLPEALESLVQATEREPASVHGWVHKALVLGTMGRFDDAIRDIDLAIRLDTRNPETWDRKGHILKAAGRTGEAIASFDSALEIDGKRSETWQARGNALVVLGHMDEAIESFRKATEVGPQDSDAWGNLGYAFAVVERFEDAIGAFDKALAVQPNLARAWESKGFALFHLGRDKEAIECLERSLRIVPKDATDLYNRAVTFGFLGRQAEAESTFHEAVKAARRSMDFELEKKAIDGLRLARRLG